MSKGIYLFVQKTNVHMALKMQLHLVYDFQHQPIDLQRQQHAIRSTNDSLWVTKTDEQMLYHQAHSTVGADRTPMREKNQTPRTKKEQYEFKKLYNKAGIYLVVQDKEKERWP